MKPQKQNNIISNQSKYFGRQYNLDGYGSPMHSWVDRKIYKTKQFIHDMKQLFYPLLSKLDTEAKQQMNDFTSNNAAKTVQNSNYQKDSLNHQINSAETRSEKTREHISYSPSLSPYDKSEHNI